MQLYELGYYQMPMYMQEMILSGLQRKENETVWVQDRTPNPLPNAKTAMDDDKRYSTLSRGLYEEVKEKKQFEQYGKFVLDTHAKKIVKLESENSFQFLIDPVVFAWSVDPLTHKYASWSPYVFVMNNPIKNIDPDGRDTLVMHRSTQLQEKSNSETAVYKVTFSMIENGVKRPLELELYMFSNIARDEPGDNSMTKEKFYKLTFEQMPKHAGRDGWENTIKTSAYAVYFHPAKTIQDLGGCKGLCDEFTTVNENLVETHFQSSIDALAAVKNLYNENSSSLTGEKFLMKPNSVASSGDGTIQMTTIGISKISIMGTLGLLMPAKEKTENIQMPTNSPSRKSK